MLKSFNKKKIYTKFESSISISSGDVILETNEENVLLIDMTYKGAAVIISKLPRGFAIAENKGRLMIIKCVNTPMPSLLFSFQGKMDILSVKAYTNSSSSFSNIIRNNHQYKGISDTWNSLNSNWQEYVGENIYGDPEYNDEQLNRVKATGKPLILGNNLGVMPKDFILNGQEYMEDVYYDTRGFFYTKEGKVLNPRFIKKRLSKIINNFRR